MGSIVQLSAADGTQVPAYVATPAAPAKAAVLVIQEIFGVNSHIREVADAYASEGFLTIAPAMFQRVQAQVELGYAEADMGAGMALKTAVEALPEPGALQDIQAAIDHAHASCGGKVGIVGYCWGGLLTWRAACTLTGLSAAVPYYGGGVTTEAEQKRMESVYRDHLSQLRESMHTTVNEIRQLETMKNRFMEMATPNVVRDKVNRKD